MLQLIKVGLAKVASARILRRAALLSVCSLTFAAPAGAATIGADLSASAIYGGPSGCPCTFVPTQSDAVTVPSSGTLTAWRFKNIDSNSDTGETAALVVLNGNTAVAIDSRTLPSRPSSTQNLYEFPANIPVQAGQRLGLEVENIDGMFSSATVPSFFFDDWQPALALNETRAPTFPDGNIYRVLLFNADINGASQPVPSTPTGQVTLLNGGPSPTILTSHTGYFTEPATCELPPGSPFTCSGAIVFKGLAQGDGANVSSQASKKKTKKSVVFGRASFSIAPGATAEIKVVLTKVARRMLSSTHKLKGTLTTTSTLTDGTKSSVTQTLTVKLKHKPKHH